MTKNKKCLNCGYEEIKFKNVDEANDKIKKCKICNDIIIGSVRLHNKSDNHIKYKTLKDKLNEIKLNDIDKVNLYLDSLMICD